MDRVTDSLISSIEEGSGFRVSPLVDIVVAGVGTEDQALDRVSVIVDDEDNRLQAQTQVVDSSWAVI
jgi:hypothetical protein